MISTRPVERSEGLTLVELVVFIVIIGVAAFALLGSFANLLPRSPTAAQITQASQLAQERMELILGQRNVRGYNNTVDLDPCIAGPAPPICTNTLGHTVNSAGTAPAPAAPPAGPTVWNGNPIADFKLITVTVSLSGTTLAQENAVLANY